MIAVRWQRVEGGLVFAAVIAVLFAYGAGLPLWACALIFFAPDLSFAAYIAGPRIGSAVYNLVHLYGTGAGLFAAGHFSGIGWLASVGALWVAHAGFDRMAGYGLKSAEGFTITHLGRIGRQ